MLPRLLRTHFSDFLRTHFSDPPYTFSLLFLLVPIITFSFEALSSSPPPTSSMIFVIVSFFGSLFTIHWAKYASDHQKQDLKELTEQVESLKRLVEDQAAERQCAKVAPVLLYSFCFVCCDEESPDSGSPV